MSILFRRHSTVVPGPTSPGDAWLDGLAVGDPLSAMGLEATRGFRARAEPGTTPVGGADADALDCLREAVSLLRAGGLLLELPVAAVLLTEAEWRAGHEDEADRAANLALEVSGRQGSHHVLLKALSEFPAVASRRIHAVAGTDTPWHTVGRALAAQGANIQVTERIRR
ncbi:hypothetical protein [Streptomyces coeruleorubidus]|uniref:hypothetical protein n=1 Tax=Streptomyces coeruleorubidus TaxID=116188 RepID=UPI0033E6C9CC